MECSCGNGEFRCQQQVIIDVIVDSDNNFISNGAEEDGMEFAVSSSGKPYGPYSCTSCGKDVEDQG